MSAAYGRLFFPHRTMRTLSPQNSFFAPGTDDVTVRLGPSEPCESCGSHVVPATSASLTVPLWWERSDTKQGVTYGPEHTPERCRAPR